MLPDPPHKKGFYTDKPDNKTFVKWNDVSKYQTKIDKLNIYLEKQEDIRQKEMYKNYLDDIVRQKKQIKNDEKNLNQKLPNEEDFMRLQLQQKSQDDKFKQRVLQMNQQILSQQNDKRKKYKQLQIEDAQQQLKESQALDELHKIAQTERVKKNFLEFDKMIKSNQKLRQQQIEDQVKQEKQFDKAEKKHINKIMQNNERFIENVKKYQKDNNLTFDEYKKIYDQKDLETKLFEQNFIDKHYQKKLLEELQREQFDKSKKKSMQKENRNFLLNQIENNLVKNKVETFTKNKEDFVHMYESIQKQEQQIQQQENERKKMYKDNLNELLEQMKLKKKSQSINHMSKTEAKHNNHSVVRVDFEQPTTDLIGGIPGFSKPYERVRQLQVIENNFKNSQYRIEQLMKHNQKSQNLNNKLNFSTFKKDYLNKFGNQIENNNKVDFDNEYQYIRHKNTTKPFNIISGQLKGYETFRQLIQLQ